MKQFLDVVYYILGIFTNIVLVLFFVFFVIKGAQKGYEYGRNLIYEETRGKLSKEVAITIPEDATTQQIGEILQEADLVSNKYVFWLQARLNGTYKLFKTGDFTLDMAMTSNEIMELLQQEHYDEKAHLTITIAEGLTMAQIGALAESLNFFTKEDFLLACGEFNAESYGITIPDDRPNRLEGYLFPDTYFLPEDAEPNDLIERMLDRFSTMTASVAFRAEESGLTVDNVITIASIIEKEIKRAEERSLASAVIYNRLNTGMPLQMCSSILYALDKRKDRLLDEDLQIQSPYNTYLYPGLPAGPICSPGVYSIEAALLPEPVNYLYFVVKDEDTGEHVFTNDYNEFIDAKVIYNQKF
ncbi:cell division protein YceG [Clostridia bacterium]|nr:cell division protein YceG [Clostridia bacterium]